MWVFLYGIHCGIKLFVILKLLHTVKWACSGWNVEPFMCTLSYCFLNIDLRKSSCTSTTLWHKFKGIVWSHKFTKAIELLKVVIELLKFVIPAYSTGGGFLLRTTPTLEVVKDSYSMQELTYFRSLVNCSMVQCKRLKTLRWVLCDISEHVCLS